MLINKNPMFIFDLANNHGGDIQHGKNIIQSLYHVYKSYPLYTFVIKFQYRNLDTFIHPDYKNRFDIKNIKRFTETKLDSDQYLQLKHYAEELGFLTACTPFDEESVDLIEKHKFDFIKIASCSLTDWPLLERVVLSDKPIILSTAGASFEDIDAVYTFLKNRNKDFAIMHCVAEYPTPYSQLQLNKIEDLKKRYDVPIGFSSHEDMFSQNTIQIATAKGATIFEKHVDYIEAGFPINKYSATVGQIAQWLRDYEHGIMSCQKFVGANEDEKSSLLNLRRGIYTNRFMYAGEKITKDDVYFAIPCLEGNLSANDFSKHTEIILKTDFGANVPLEKTRVEIKNKNENIKSIVKKLMKIVKESGVAIPSKINLQLSHHYGIEQFEKYGAGIIDIVNREYCKKLLIVLPNQTHPNHYHLQKEEVFQLLYGDLIVSDIIGNKKSLSVGETFLVSRDQNHGFYSETGCVFEEISSTHYKNDSFYDDPIIMENFDNRKTDLIISRDFEC